MMLSDFKLKSGYIHPLSWELILSFLWATPTNVAPSGLLEDVDYGSKVSMTISVSGG